MDKLLKLKKLRAIARRFGIQEDPSRGKESEVAKHYVKGFRERFYLTAAEGVSDKDFYGKGA